MDKIKYFAAPGRQLPIEQDLATAPGGGLLIVGDAAAGGEPVLLDPRDGRVVRMISAGDLVPLEPAAGTARSTPATAALEGTNKGK